MSLIDGELRVEFRTLSLRPSCHPFLRPSFFLSSFLSSADSRGEHRAPVKTNVATVLFFFPFQRIRIQSIFNFSPGNLFPIEGALLPKTRPRLDHVTLFPVRHFSHCSLSLSLVPISLPGVFPLQPPCLCEHGYLYRCVLRGRFLGVSQLRASNRRYLRRFF